MDRPAEELALCRRIASGEQQLFATIVNRYSGLVAGVIAGQGVARDDIEDLAQETFVNVYKGLAGFRGASKLSSWIYRIAVNVARGHLKASSKRQADFSIEESSERGVVPVDQRAARTEQSVIRNRMLAAAMEQLPPEQREALVLYYVEELSYEEIAEALGRNLNTVRTHIRRGKQRLAELLDESLNE